MTDKPLKKLKLCCGSWQTVILPEYAANPISVRCGDDEIMRTPADDAVFRAQPIVYGSAFLFPPDRTIGGSFCFGGRLCRLPVNDSRGLSNLHGLMADAPMTVLSHTDSEASLFYKNTGDRFPFPFELTVTCRLSEAGLHMSYLFRNTGDTAMPLLFGLHSNFADPGYIRVPLSEEMPMNMQTLVPDPEPHTLSPLAAEISGGTHISGREISGFYTSAGSTAELGAYLYTVSGNFSHWVLWNGSGSDGFISVEPQSGPVNGLKLENGYITLEKEQTIEFTTEIRRKNHE